jgi:hypothetical protein
MRFITLISVWFGTSATILDQMTLFQNVVGRFITDSQEEHDKLTTILEWMASDFNKLKAMEFETPVTSDPDPRIVHVLDELWDRVSFEAMATRLKQLDHQIACSYIDFSIRRDIHEQTEFRDRLAYQYKTLRMAENVGRIISEALKDPTGQLVQVFSHNRLVYDWCFSLADEYAKRDVIDRTFPDTGTKYSDNMPRPEVTSIGKFHIQEVAGAIGGYLEYSLGHLVDLQEQLESLHSQKTTLQTVTSQSEADSGVPPIDASLAARFTNLVPVANETELIKTLDGSTRCSLFRFLHARMDFAIRSVQYKLDRQHKLTKTLERYTQILVQLLRGETTGNSSAPFGKGNVMQWIRGVVNTQRKIARLRQVEAAAAMAGATQNHVPASEIPKYIMDGVPMDLRTVNAFNTFELRLWKSQIYTAQEIDDRRMIGKPESLRFNYVFNQQTRSTEWEVDAKRLGEALEIYQRFLKKRLVSLEESYAHMQKKHHNTIERLDKFLGCEGYMAPALTRSFASSFKSEGSETFQNLPKPVACAIRQCLLRASSAEVEAFARNTARTARFYFAGPSIGGRIDVSFTVAPETFTQHFMARMGPGHNRFYGSLPTDEGIEPGLVHHQRQCGRGIRGTRESTRV